MYGKRDRGSLERVTTHPLPEKTQQAKEQTEETYNAYTLVTREGPPPLCYLPIKIHGHPLRALIDSGSNRTLLGKEGIAVVRHLQLPTEQDRISRIRTADSRITEIRERIDLKCELKGYERSIIAYMLPNLVVPCILGVDFLRTFELIIDFVRAEWHFAADPSTRYSCRIDDLVEKGNDTVCSGISELTYSQEEHLRHFIKTKIPDSLQNPGITSLTQHIIDVGDNAPIKQRCYLVSPKVQEAIRDEVDKMLAAGFIEPSFSEWSNPLVMVKKANGKYRFCLDFRKVNSISRKDAYPLPNMTGILDKLRSAHYISTIDLSQAYFQIPLAEKCREITAFSVPGKGLYHFTRMPYGITGAPATFQRLLDKLIGPEMEPYAFTYLDDIVIATPTFEQHLEWLQRVIDKIDAAGLTINLEKCEFCRSQVKYLGFLVHKDGLKIDPEKMQPIMEYPAPKNLKQLRRLLGMASWYRRFLPQFATITEPFTRLLKKNKRWEWGDDQQKALEEL